MTKKILSLIVLTASMFSVSAFAQKPADCKAANCPEKPACTEVKCGRPDPFIGITLTPDQQTKLKQLNDAKKAKCDAARKDAKNKIKADRMQRDSIAKASKKEYLDGVKAILGPDQYVVFLENIVLTQPSPKAPMHHGDKAVKKHGQKHGDRRGPKAQPGK